MPSKKVVRKTRPRRRYRKKRSLTVLPIGGFHQSQLVKLRYVETVRFNPPVGGISHNVFRANSLHDPNVTGVGHQPSNFDRWANTYDRYTVLGAKCTAYPVYTNGTNSAKPGTMALCLSEAGNKLTIAHGSGGIDNILEQPRLRASMNYVAGLNAPPTKLSKKFSAKKFFGTKNLIGQSPYSADVTTSPAEGAFFEVALISPDDTNDPSEVTIRIVIDYIAMFTEPKLTDAS